MFFTFLAYGIVAGYFAGFTGLGAGVFLMPFFLLLSIPYHQSVNASLIAVFFSSITGMLANIKGNGILKEVCISIGIPAAITAAVSSLYLIQITSPVMLMIAFSGLMFLVADFNIIVLKKPSFQTDINKINHLSYFGLYIIVGILVGLGSGLLGIGGGIIIVPLLIYIAHYPVKEAVKTAVIIMIISSFFGMSKGIITNTLPYQIGSACAIGAVIGSFLGSIALKYIKRNTILKLNFILTIIIGLIMLLKAIIF
jgi:uncharacterized protein